MSIWSTGFKRASNVGTSHFGFNAIHLVVRPNDFDLEVMPKRQLRHEVFHQW